MNPRDVYNTWCNRTDLTDSERAELAQIATDELAITKAFGAKLHFGTAGLRGIMGLGPNCLNRFTIAWATAGIAEWLIETNNTGGTVVISTDSRLNHKEFARTTASVLVNYGFTVLLWDSPTATPILSWSVRHFHAVAGIMITASHNPRDYNGYKAYDANGCQLLSEDANIVTRHADAYFDGKALSFDDDFDALVASGKVRLLHDELADYLAIIKSTVRPLQTDPQTSLSIGYTPLHGVGGLPVRQVLEDAGMTVHIVENQFAPDGHFPTIATPNPELPVAFDGLFALVATTDCDILIATDPDSDRIGVAAKDANGVWQLITGNQLGALLIDYLAEVRGVKEGDTIITTTVTSQFSKALAHYHGFELEETFTGFKYIGNAINATIANPARTYVFGFEESYGYLYGDHARDKDAIVTAYLVAAMAQHDKARGLSLIDRLYSLYDKVGAFSDVLINLVFDPIPGQEPISDTIMKRLRQTPPETIADIPVSIKIDYITGIRSLPKENVIQYQLMNGSVVCLRPSGTEPKMKCYISARSDSLQAAEALSTQIADAFHHFVTQLKEDASS
ncbi:MAG: phospho-sugar mutase [Peptococcaceae bacterium]|nr:phospho-sugar mutase [Peptococcaceae bacterium]